MWGHMTIDDYSWVGQAWTPQTCSWSGAAWKVEVPPSSSTSMRGSSWPDPAVYRNNNDLDCVLLITGDVNLLDLGDNKGFAKSFILPSEQLYII